MAAAARPPGLGDARVPCPLCGGLIHPVAGRCKHCKEDLSSFRAGRPQAATPLPSLVTPVSGIAQLAAPVPAEGHGTAIPVTIPAAREGSQPILPPRPTSQWRMKAQKPRGWLRHWPMITIVLAVIAMLVAVVIMVLPQSDKHDGKKRLMAPPAPDRMNTDPLGRQSQADPWGDPDQRNPPQASPDPDDQAQNAPPRQTPDPPKAPPAQDPDDIFGGLGGSSGGGTMGGVLGGTGGFMLTMVNRACKKLQSCPSSGSSTLSSVCDGINAIPLPPMPSASSCPHAQKCLDAIDKLDCNAKLDDPYAAVSLLQDCSKAATDC